MTELTWRQRRRARRAEKKKEKKRRGRIKMTISLNAFPDVAVPAYWVFGRSKFDGYQMMRHSKMLAESDVETAVIDGKGGTATPGLIDMHQHLTLNSRSLLNRSSIRRCDSALLVFQNRTVRRLTA
jgi:adenine deaminase